MTRSALILAAALVLTATLASALPAQEDPDAGTLPPIPADYQGRIARWAGRYYADPKGVGPTAISEPQLMRDGTGRLLWLVCVEVANPPRSTASGAPELVAFGFAPDLFSAPHERYRTTLTGADCESRSLAYRPFPDFAEPPPRRVRKAARR